MAAEQRQQPASDTEQRPASDAARRVQQYMLEGEEISYALRYRPTGIVSWVKSLFGVGVTHWFVTNQRLIHHTKTSSGFAFKEVPLGNVGSVEYGSKLSIPTIVAGVVLILFGALLALQAGEGAILLSFVGVLLVAYAYFRRQQVLTVKGSGGVDLSLAMSKGDDVDDFLWYVHAEREKHPG